MHIFLVAGEPSGDRLGAALMAGLRALAPGVRFSGVGGPAMAAEGLQSLFPMAELSVMGLLEVLPRYPALRRRMIETAEALVAAAPDAVVTIDSPDFCLRVLARARAARPGLRTIHYVAPSVWAWRPGRARRMAPLVDHVLALLPFEPPLMEAAGMGCSFVGHPAAAVEAA
ncbi:MAG: lipid-A-disaccharide synthase, partial [Gemmobacter sp.]